jgi:hypothetical protein
MPQTHGVTLGLVVEGQGEVEAAPILIRRIAQAAHYYSPIRFAVRRSSRSGLLRPDEFERTIEGLTRQIGRSRPLLVLLDADDDCPVELAEKMRARCNVGHADVPISIVLAKKEYEAWFLAAAKSLSGQRGLAAELKPPSEPESVRGAKEWLDSFMDPSQSYSPTRHQPAYSAAMDLVEARQARSFRKLESEVFRLLGLK